MNLKRVSAAAAISFIMVGGASQPAGAAQIPYNCPANNICFYHDANGLGAIWSAPVGSTGCRVVGMDNATSSIFNNTNYNYHVYSQIDNTACGEGNTQYWATVWAHSKGNMNGFWNDVISRFERQG